MSILSTQILVSKHYSPQIENRPLQKVLVNPGLWQGKCKMSLK